MQSAVFDPSRVLGGLRAHGVRYVLVGGLAAVAHGSPSGTDDVDVVLAGDDENLQRLGLALLDLGGTMSSDPADGGARVTFTTVAGRLDVVEIDDFAGLEERAATIDVSRGVTAKVASLDDLVELKRRAGDLPGAAHVASLVVPEPPPAAAAAPRVFVGEGEHDEPPPEHPGVRRRVWKALEDVDGFLTRLTEGSSRR